jgi:2-dehydro-3-deoxygalactonokinase
MTALGSPPSMPRSVPTMPVESAAAAQKRRSAQADADAADADAAGGASDTAKNQAALIALDWGTTALRAYLFDAADS